MVRRTLDEVLEEVRTLTPAEQEQLRDALDRLLASHHIQSPETELERRLMESGLLSEVRPPIVDHRPYSNRRPVEVKGKPLSEVIIEERR